MSDFELRRLARERIASLDMAGDVGAVVDAIKRLAGDDEVAHSLEDDLHVAVLRLVAAGHPEARELAAAALETVDVDFARHCA